MLRASMPPLRCVKSKRSPADVTAGVLRAVAAAAILAASTLPARGEPRTSGCVGVRADVTADAAGDVAIACDGARDAWTFLRPLVAEPLPRLQIDLVHRLPPNLRADAIGCYAHETRRISVLTSRDFLARERWFGISPTRALYRSIVAHEVAHALVGCVLGERRLPSAAHEYVAYVTMFATMDDATREQVLAAMPAQGVDSVSKFNDITYAFDPMGFGVEACRHWRDQPEGLGYLRRIVAGELIPELLLN